MFRTFTAALLSTAAVAAAIAPLAADAALAERLGQQAKRQVASLTWSAAVDRLVLR